MAPTPGVYSPNSNENKRIRLTTPKIKVKKNLFPTGKNFCGFEQPSEKCLNPSQGSPQEKQPCESVSIPKSPSLKKENITSCRKQENSILRNDIIPIGLNKTPIPASLYDNINWSSARKAVRKLLRIFFDRETLATHTLTFGASTSFLAREKQGEKNLDPLVVDDIIYVVKCNCGVRKSFVRDIIVATCAIESRKKTFLA